MNVHRLLLRNKHSLICCTLILKPLLFALVCFYPVRANAQFEVLSFLGLSLRCMNLHSLSLSVLFQVAGDGWVNTGVQTKTKGLRSWNANLQASQ